jgi:hypothetical protein
MENGESSPKLLEGSPFFLISAVACLCATSSAVFSSLCRPLVSDPASRESIDGVVFLFFIVAMGVSILGSFSLLVCGPREAGRLVVGGHRIPPLVAWMSYLAAFFIPWIFLSTGVIRVI